MSSTGHMACIAWTGREVRCGAVPCVARRGWRVIDERARDKRQWERDWLAGWLAGCITITARAPPPHETRRH